MADVPSRCTRANRTREPLAAPVANTSCPVDATAIWGKPFTGTVMSVARTIGDPVVCWVFASNGTATSALSGRTTSKYPGSTYRAQKPGMSARCAPVRGSDTAMRNCELSP
jgi:hypothetical protein